MATVRPRILIADDDPLIVRLVRTNLERVGFATLTARDSEEAVAIVAESSPDLIILDVELPRQDGFEVCRRIRAVSLTPVVMLTARVEQADVLRGFAAGADDYIAKPFAPAELIARLGAVLRRTRQGVPADSPAIIRCGQLVVDLLRRQVFVDSEPVALSPTEFSVLQQLALNAGKVLTHTDLLTRVWGGQYRDDRDYLWAYMRRLRRKLERDPENPQHLRCLPGVGYMLDNPPAGGWTEAEVPRRSSPSAVA